MKLTITGISYPTNDSVTLRFKKPKELESYKSGQHALLTFLIGDEKLTRSYSFHTASQIDPDIEITVRVINGGKVSNFLHTATPENIVAELERIDGRFFIEPSESNERHLILFAGGSGITPIMSMIKSILHREPLSSVSLIYSNRSADRIIFRTELQQLREHYADRFNVLHIITQPTEIDPDFPVFYKGQLSKLIVRKLIKSLTNENSLTAQVYLCGPFGFMQTIEESIVSLNLNLIIHKENFFIPTEGLTAFDFDSLAPQDVMIQWGEAKYLMNVASGQSILMATLRSDLKLPHACKEGQCGTCRAILVSGQVKLRKNHVLTELELQQSQILTCQAYPISGDVVIRPIR